MPDSTPLAMPVWCGLIDCQIEERGMGADGDRPLRRQIARATQAGYQQSAGHNARHHVTGVNRLSVPGQNLERHLIV
jgi:hypothetical protein